MLDNTFQKINVFEKCNWDKFIFKNHTYNTIIYKLVWSSFT